MSSKSQLPMPSFVGDPSNQSNQLCFPQSSSSSNSKAEKSESHQMTLCGCRKAPKSQCLAAIGKISLLLANPIAVIDVFIPRITIKW